MFKQNYLNQLEEDDIPLCQYVVPYQQQQLQQQQNQQQQQQLQYQQQQYSPQWKSRQSLPRFVPPTGYFPPPMIITNPQPIIRRPSYPATPSSLLDTYSDDDEDDEDLVPIAVLQSPTRNQQQFQSAAEKYKEKVKAQLQ
ncbi:hypothetical protein [Parasitella parasitica]|uniref:Uncharacterized protein n=1 Tax=Parasitella parasitica TaxID=35722 RepID=A0A0B7N7B4_9FUNG|nr:hypothetical protein [Parasitella parasitica]